MENREGKIGWKMLFFTVWLRKESRRDRKQERKFSLLDPPFLSFQIGRKMGREKWVEIHFTQIPSHLPLTLFMIWWLLSLLILITLPSHSIETSWFSFLLFFFFRDLIKLIHSINCFLSSLYLHYCNFYIIIIKIIIKIYIYDVINFILFNEYK